ncbi:helicase SEN1 [Plectosphaerella plurivora]|uniref:Helicase SEN1 n=1 Tax=Plectosphaerella plurivora TaxID=936078 RepID=A0A9P8V0B4_9PEZI|nr:helicase SEN1 [Plectosphaerella plurivora]
MSSRSDDLLTDWYKRLEKVPESPHLLCPKVDDDDEEDYEDLTTPGETITIEEKKQRVKDGEERLEIAYWNSLLMAYGRDGAGVWLKEWDRRVTPNLHSCDKCVTNWHMNRKKYLQIFATNWDEETVANLTDIFHRYDFPRITSGLKWALKQVDKAESEGRQFTKKDLGDEQARILICVFEALCCMPYLSSPERRADFTTIFDHLSLKKPLKLGDNVLLPAMTYFLFETDPIRRNFAVKAYDRIPSQSVQQELFNWAIRDDLLAIIKRAATWDPNDASLHVEVEHFWQGINYILKTLNGEVMLKGLRSLEFKPTLVDLIFSHIHFRSEAILLYVLQALSTLLKTAPLIIRDTILDARPFVIVEQIFVAPLFPRLLAQSVVFSLQDSDNTSEIVSHSVGWIGDWIRSIPLNEKSDACEQLLHLLYTKQIKIDSLGDEGKLACIRAGLDALEHVLVSFMPSSVNLTSASTSVYVNSVLKLMLTHKTVINDALNEPREVGYALGVQTAAMKVIRAALILDTRITAAEHRELRKHDAEGKTPVNMQSTVLRDSAAIWETTLDNLRPGQRSMAQAMVTAMCSLIPLDAFRPKRKVPDSLSPAKKRINEQVRKTAIVCGKILSRLCDFKKEELLQLWVHDQLARIVLALTFHSEEDLREASRELVKVVSDEITHSDALRVELTKRLDITLASLNYGVLQLANPTPLPWGFATHVIVTSRDVLDALCDESSGILRSRVLEVGEEKGLSTWWSAQWRYIEKAFLTTSQWSHEVEVDIMKNFCRSTIELAEMLMEQVGLISAAMQQKRQQQEDGSETGVMHDLLKEPRDRLYSIVNMIRLRDLHLVSVAVKVLAKLLNRLRESDHEIPLDSKDFILKACTKLPNGRYEIMTNMAAQQKAELIKALGEEEEEEDDVEVVSVRPVTVKKQTTIDAWSKSAPATAPRARTNRDDVLDLSSTLEKNKGLLSQINASRPATSTKAKPLASRPREQPPLANKALIESRKQAAAEKKKRDALAIAKAKALRGTEVKGLTGVVGKEHAPQKNEIMVDSDEEESDESGDDADVQKLISKGKQGLKAVDEATRRRELALLEKTKGPVKKTRIVRSAKDMRARLIPPMDQLHQAILEWDIFYNGNDPPNVRNISKVADTYTGPDQYKQTFWLLLVSEAWRSFVTSKDEATSKPYGLKISSRMNVDRFLEITASMPSAENKDRGLNEGDIILLSKSATPLADPNAPHALARIWKRTYKRDILEVTYRLNSKNNPLQGSLNIGCELHAIKITNMTTIEREYAALESLKYYDLMDEVLKAEPSPVLKYSEEAVTNVINNYQLNPGQAKAILGARDNDGFTLIQGPPGTGKTKTIIAMVGALLTGNISTSGAVAVGAAGQGPNKQGAPLKKKILVCAPSNAAVDELVLRLKQGVKTLPGDSRSGTTHKINVLRLGRSDAINAAVRDVTLDELVKARMEGDTTKAKLLAEKDKIHADAAGIKAQVDELRQRLMAVDAKDPEYLALSRNFDTLKQQQRRIGQKIDEQKESGNTISRELEIKRKQVQQEIIDSAQVLCATLSGSGHEMFKNLSVDFETVIIDEAAQCVELSALIPLKYGATKCVLVGDPKQLPPTVLSQSAARFGYDQSLFVRMQRNHPDYIHMLDRQYRMHPQISAFPSLEFYEGKLVDGDDMAGLRKQPWHTSPLLGPYRFFDVEGTQERGHRGQSLVNIQELRVAMQIYARFRADYGRDMDIRGKIGIITPYKAQLQELKSRFTMEYGEQVTEDIEFNTTDAFQGRECEIIIFSCVRASPTGGEELPTIRQRDEAPTIRVEPPRKRPREGDDSPLQQSKRVRPGTSSPVHSSGGGQGPPTGPRNHQQKPTEQPRKPRQATDPSAMAALQMTAPTRPPAVATPPDGTRSGQAPTTGLSRVHELQRNGRPEMQGGPRPPRPKNKGGNSMFIPSKPKKR